MNDFIVGAMASLAATFLIYFSRHIWNKWFSVLYYKKYPSVGGHYLVKENVRIGSTIPWYENEKQILKIKQFGNKLQGSFNVNDGDNEKHVFPLNGIVETDRSILLAYKSNDSKYTAKGSLLLRLGGINSDIHGQHIFICLRCEEIHSFRVTLNRIN